MASDKAPDVDLEVSKSTEKRYNSVLDEYMKKSNPKEELTPSRVLTNHSDNAGPEEGTYVSWECPDTPGSMRQSYSNTFQEVPVILLEGQPTPDSADPIQARNTDEGSFLSIPVRTSPSSKTTPVSSSSDTPARLLSYRSLFDATFYPPELDSSGDAAQQTPTDRSDQDIFYTPNSSDKKGNRTYTLRGIPTAGNERSSSKAETGRSASEAGNGEPLLKEEGPDRSHYFTPTSDKTFIRHSSASENYRMEMEDMERMQDQDFITQQEQAEALLKYYQFWIRVGWALIIFGSILLVTATVILLSIEIPYHWDDYFGASNTTIGLNYQQRQDFRDYLIQNTDQ